mmetsp:Transcript_250/g.445  ORF Transcript_250/g.445 Transcript_250/m.445 type:complete len:165 (-) Transcript_250:44-538(-)
MRSDSLWTFKTFCAFALIITSSVVLGHTSDVCSRTLQNDSCRGVQAWIITAGALSALVAAILTILYFSTMKAKILSRSLEFLVAAFMVCWWAAAVATLSTVTYNFSDLTVGFGFFSLFLWVLYLVLSCVKPDVDRGRAPGEHEASAGGIDGKPYEMAADGYEEE